MKKSKECSKIISIVSLMAVIMALFTGCGKDAATTADFKSIADEKGFVVSDASEQFSSYDYITEATIVAPSNLSYQIEFYVLSDSSYAQSFFESNKSKFELTKENGYAESSGSGKNYNSYTLTSGSKYMFIERVDATVIYVNTDSTNKDAVDEFIKELKY